MLNQVDERFSSIVFPNNRQGNRYLRFVNWRMSTPAGHKDVYREEHHILPKSLFPEYSNLTQNPWNRIYFTAREHFIAHWMLYKAFGGKMANAFFYMVSCGGTVVNARLYQKLREDFSQSMSRIKKGVGIPTDVRRKMSASRTGLKLSDEHKRHISEGNKGLVRNEETRRRISASKIGKKMPPRSEKHLEKLRRPKAKRLCPHCMKEIAHHLFNRWHGDNCKNNPNRPIPLGSPRYPVVICPHCGKGGRGSNMIRYHFANCKEAA